MSEESTTDQAPAEQISVEDLLSTHDMVGEWIRFADAKAAVVLTVAGAIASLLIPTFEAPPDPEFESTRTVVLYWTSFVFFVIWMIVLALSCIFAFRCINPFMDRGRHPSIGDCDHFHPAAISARYSNEQSDEFVENFVKLGEEGFRKEVLSGLLIDSHISTQKYNRVTRAIRLLGVSVVFGLIYGLLIQFRS